MPERTTAIRQHRGTNGAPSHHADFLHRVAAREAGARVSKRPTPLSVEQHAAHRKHLEGVLFIKPKYAAETKINVSGIFEKWKRYCSSMKVGDWKETITDLSRATMQDFFFWVCERHSIKSWGTSLEYIRQFSQLFKTVTGRYPDRNDIKELYKYHDNVLILLFGLRAPNIDGKPVINVDSLRVILTFNIAYDTGIQPLERQRLQLSGCYQIICYTGVRPAELVDNERKVPKDGLLQELFDAKAVMSSCDDAGDKEAVDPDSRELFALL